MESRLGREEINRLPVRRYEGPVRVVRTAAEAVEAAALLRRDQVLGFDTETRPSFRKGEAYPPALVQLAGRGVVCIFQLRHVEFPEPLSELLSAPDVVKAGVALGRDVAELKQVRAFTEGGFVDLGNMARRLGIQNHGLRGLAAVLLGFRITKRAQKSNWARDDLTPAQIQYAATDAWVSREIYLKLLERSALPAGGG
ncbi:MAG: 3'-5' exonuclease domain-containing protein 2 [Kiritimatiellae bacterium]|nr:3'-5' exonuclease domain-containing protein 2 [Kiritimatiellia bacterium]